MAFVKVPTVAAFRFGPVRESYANEKYRNTRNVGVIGVAVFNETARIRGLIARFKSAPRLIHFPINASPLRLTSSRWCTGLARHSASCNSSALNAEIFHQDLRLPDE